MPHAPTSVVEIQLIVNLLVEKGVFTEKEFNERYKTDVADRMREMQKKLQEQLRQQIAESQKAEEVEAPQPTEPPHPDTAVSPPATSDVVLPSEKAGNVVKFPTKG